MKELIQLKSLRELKNYTQSYLANKLGISQSYYSKLENGYAKLTHEMQKRAISALGIEVLHPLFIGEKNILESLEQQQMEFTSIKSKVEVLEQQIKKLESDYYKLTNQIKAKENFK